jgi:aspartate dehydrogenase
LEAWTLIKIGIIGCGAIGSLIAKAFEDRLVKCDELILFDIKREKAERLQQSLHMTTRRVQRIEEMVEAKPAIIVEAASQQAVSQYASLITSAGIQMIVMSVGGLLDMKLENDRIHVPSGAIGGLDAISSVALAGIEKVVLTTRKGPKTLDMNNKRVEIAYEGNAQGAVALFPKEMNVAATLALAVSPDKVQVRVLSDPEADKNVHEVTVKWRNGNMFFKFENDPHPENPKTSALAAWSAIKLLKDILEKRV